MADQRFGGYSCEFVDTIPEELQTECCICLYVLKDPYMIDCCGYRFCKNCIETHVSRNDSCPLCKHDCPRIVADKQLARILRQKMVRCTHKEEGCTWTGELHVLDNHLNLTERLKGCNFQHLMCSYCNSSFQRSQIESHELKCPKRVLICEYCNDFQCVQEELAEHWEYCDHYPIVCPKGCGAKMIRLSLDEHLEDLCSLAIIDCEFFYAGCEVRIPRKDMKEHLKQSMKDHFAMLKNKHSRLERAYEEEKNENGQLKEMVEAEKNKREVDEQKDQVFVENLSWGTNEQMLRSLFGQFGRLHSVKFYSASLNALVKYQDDDSIQKLFETYNSRGIKLRGAQLKCVHLYSYNFF